MNDYLKRWLDEENDKRAIENHYDTLSEDQQWRNQKQAELTVLGCKIEAMKSVIKDDYRVLDGEPF